MRIVLGSILLAVAFAAPISEDATAAPLVEIPTAYEAHLRRLLDNASPPAAADESESNANLPDRSDKWPIEDVLETVKVLKFLGAPEPAISEYFAAGIQPTTVRSITPEMFIRVKQWGKRWNFEAINRLHFDFENQQPFLDKNFSLDEATKHSGIEDETTSASPTTKWCGMDEEEIRELRNAGLPEAAIKEFYEEGFGHPPYDEEKKDRMIEWDRKVEVCFGPFL
ncbi:hypothetical protein PENTCL1PPCAC_8675 [Pristionchus entomophagus]|uniref:Uncharacterized protein n=1 Tax=Pristionchus entomophagus TaxID=358040 RepID=A0AAV5SUY4_9BILA|nr:hypothetical protein PENTCL1PPCAC_8675 [Pristionchus entomophagus]